jgi:hypothetical protein
MFVLTRLYRFYRRCGMTRRRSLKRAIEVTLRDLSLTRFQPRR